MLVPGGVITERRDGATAAPVEKETIEQVIEE
jgi:hypothetical protein